MANVTNEEDEDKQLPCIFPFWHEGRWRLECVSRLDSDQDGFWCPVAFKNTSSVGDFGIKVSPQNLQGQCLVIADVG